jgi:hypothetical protein
MVDYNSLASAIQKTVRATHERGILQTRLVELLKDTTLIRLAALADGKRLLEIKERLEDSANTILAQVCKDIDYLLDAVECQAMQITDLKIDSEAYQLGRADILSKVVEHPCSKYYYWIGHPKDCELCGGTKKMKILIEEPT